MNKCFLDANVLIYFKDDTSDHHNQTVQMLKNLKNSQVSLFVSPLCLDEIIHSLKFLLKNNLSKTRMALNEILSLPTLQIVNPPTNLADQMKIIEIMETFSLAPRDAYHLLTMQTNNIDGFATFDNDFKKVFQAKLLTPAL